MDFVILRHGKTISNKSGRLIGLRTDEPLSDEGIRETENHIEIISKYLNDYDDIRLYVSPMERCVQTAKTIFGEHVFTCVDELKEMDFGIFEGKNYIEMSDNPEYIKWIESNCESKIPDGEDKGSFTKRCMRGFYKILDEFYKLRQLDDANVLNVIVCHGGTIMSIMSTITGSDYYDFQAKNADGYYVRMREVEKDEYEISFNGICSGVHYGPYNWRSI